MKVRIFSLRLEVEAPVTATEAEISNAVNAALDEPLCNWDDWTVGAASVVDVRVENREDAQ